MKTIIILFIATFATLSAFAQKSKADSSASKQSLTMQVNYTCPMHPDYVTNHPGNCPKCSSKLVVDRTSSKHGKIIYTCSMHPDVVSDKPGKCSVCGMDLTEVKIKTKSKKR